MTLRILLLSFVVPFVSALAQTKPAPSEFRTDALRTGGNEYDVWSGYSPNSFSWIGKTDARRLFMAGAGWRRVILASDSVAWKFTVDIVPVALVSQPVVVFQTPIISGTGSTATVTGCSGTPVATATVPDLNGQNLGPCAHASRRTTYGFGLEPVGFDFNFRRRHRFQPVVGINGGFLKFTHDVPVSNSNSFNFTFSLRGGVQIFTGESRSFTIGYRFHHISNANTGNPFNPGIDSSFTYVSYSFHR